MARTKDYLPVREAELVTWTGEFLTELQAKPAGYYGVAADRISEYATTRTNFVNAYNVANNPATRVKSAITAKNDKKATLLRSTRSVVDVIQAFPQTTNAMRDDLGIAQRGKKPTPSPIPTQAFVKVEKIDGRDVTVNIQQNSSTKGKPRGAIGANIMVAYSEQPPVATTEWTFAQTTGKTKTTITLDAVSDACTVWISAFWFNGRKATGPASTPVSVNLGATSASPMSMKIKKAA